MTTPFVLALGLLALTGRAHGLLAGDKLPELSVTTLEGDSATIRCEGRKALLIFSVDCPHCRSIASRLSVLASGSGTHALAGISLSPRGSTCQTISELGISFPVVLADPAVVHTTWQVHHVPVLLLIDGTGAVLHSLSGSQPEIRLAAFMRELLQGD